MKRSDQPRSAEDASGAERQADSRLPSHDDNDNIKISVKLVRKNLLQVMD
jgi:hypothetical protein